MRCCARTTASAVDSCNANVAALCNQWHCARFIALPLHRDAVLHLGVHLLNYAIVILIIVVAVVPPFVLRKVL